MLISESQILQNVYITIYFLSLNTERIDRPTDGFCDPGNPRREPRAAPLHEHASVRHRGEQAQAQQQLRAKSQIPQKVMSLNKCLFRKITKPAKSYEPQ